MDSGVDGGVIRGKEEEAELHLNRCARYCLKIMCGLYIPYCFLSLHILFDAAVFQPLPAFSVAGAHGLKWYTSTVATILIASRMKFEFVCKENR